VNTRKPWPVSITRTRIKTTLFISEAIKKKCGKKTLFEKKCGKKIQKLQKNKNYKKIKNTKIKITKKIKNKNYKNR